MGIREGRRGGIAWLDDGVSVRHRGGHVVERWRLRREQQGSEQVERTMHRGHLRDGEIAPAEGLRGGVADAEKEARHEAYVRPWATTHRHESSPEQEACGKSDGRGDLDSAWTKRIRAQSEAQRGSRSASHVEP